MAATEWQGMAFIGDPHLSSRVPGFRADDYPRTALRKLAWCLDYADQHQLLPAITGDLFDRPRDNANWMIGELLELLRGRTVLAIAGNHDSRENMVTEDDSFSILQKSGHVIVPDAERLWSGVISGRPVIVGGSSWGNPVPDSFTRLNPETLVVWMTHHDLQLPESGVDRGINPEERQGIDIIVNGHLHKRQEPIIRGQTHWFVPGNLTRLDRSETSRTQAPSLFRLNITRDAWTTEYVEVPHESFEAVFLEAAQVDALDDLESSFVRGLAELRAQRTESGAGLVYFLQQNLPEFETAVSEEVLALAEQVTDQRIELDLTVPDPQAERDTDENACNVAIHSPLDPVANESVPAGKAITDEPEEESQSGRQRTLF